MRESQRPQILDAGLRVAGSGQGATITLERVASEAGVTKPGLMYHFPNRDALMVALVEHAAIQLRRRMIDLLSTSLEMATVADRYRAYVQAAAEGENMRAEWALWFQSAFCPELQAAWTRQLEPWLSLPDGTPPWQRSRLMTARLAADGLWAAQASGVHKPSAADRSVILAQLIDLTRDGEAE
ncbi:TetR/AcrR family transcriptional regulator [Arthrobacter sp. ISL-65]|uniref:TetR/AcrR family transcriptional regulator n=1 Tax=Arthrobacter sp. ISL-65 TaxID=2819112 RepID=UPI001BEA3F90|nr:TetR/AcrR family transcriptional regulator [Arthrobacter sp. ISL-65]MBT2547439.1 TetR family transcriptional regulator [Arthrobacter sp. ISL-65]